MEENRSKRIQYQRWYLFCDSRVHLDTGDMGKVSICAGSNEQSKKAEGQIQNESRVYLMSATTARFVCLNKYQLDNGTVTIRRECRGYHAVFRSYSLFTSFSREMNPPLLGIGIDIHLQQVCLNRIEILVKVRKRTQDYFAGCLMHLSTLPCQTSL